MEYVLENYLIKLNEDLEHITEKKLDSLIKETKNKLLEIIKDFTKIGANSFVGVSFGTIATIAYKSITEPQLFVDKISKNIPFFKKLGWLVSGKPESFSELLNRSYQILNATLQTTEVQVGMGISLISALVFTIFQFKYKSEKKAKEKVSELLDKNEKLDKDKQKVCKILSDKVYK